MISRFSLRFSKNIAVMIRDGALLLAALAVFLIIFPGLASADHYGMVEDGWEDHIKAAIFKVADTDFEEGLSMFEEYIKAFPKEPGGYFFYAAGVQEKIQKYNDFSDMPRFSRYAKKCERLCRKKLQENPDDNVSRLFLGAINGYIGLLEAKQRKLVRAFWDGVEAKKYLERVALERPEIPDTYFGLGMLYYFASRKSEKEGMVVSWIIKKFITHGKNMRDEGVEYLKRSINGESLAKDYALSALMWIHLYERRYDEAERIARIMAERFTRDNISRWILARVALVRNNCLEAKGWLNDIVSINQRENIPMSRYPDVKIALKMADLCQNIKNRRWDIAVKLNEEVEEWLYDDPKAVIEYQDERNLISFWKEENLLIQRKLRFIESK